MTPEKVGQWFAHRHPTAVKRYLLPRLGAMNFVVGGVLDGGVNDPLTLDMHGKALSSHLLALRIPVPAALAQQVAEYAAER